MSLRKILDILSRSSAQAVSTTGNRNSSEEKKYLYITTAIEKKLVETLNGLDRPDQIVFLCGSSGDGKSEILTRCEERFREKIHFHFDATHSYREDQDAIDTLNDQFSTHKVGNKAMVIGINTGMMFNYADSGAEEHNDIKDSFRAYLSSDKKDISPAHIFLNFEDYPKYELSGGTFFSVFIKELLGKLTVDHIDNPFYSAWCSESDGRDHILYYNFRMLQMDSVQDVVINTLLKLRLKNDTFLTARTILDCIHHILTGPGYLFDNLFASEKDELFRSLRQFDPCTVRARDIDLFLIQHSLTYDDAEFQDFQQSVSHWIKPADITNQPGSWVRLFYVLQDIDIGNNFHQRFRNDFRSQLFDEYIQIWKLHSQFSGDPKERKALRSFYKDGLIQAIMGFANRFAPNLSLKNQIYLNDFNGYQISAKAELRESLKQIQAEENRPTKLGHFNACLKLRDDDLPPVPVSVNFLELIRKINRGYRPNPHDKNNIVILEELIEAITGRIRDTDRLFIQKQEEFWTLVNDAEEDEIRVEH